MEKTPITILGSSNIDFVIRLSRLPDRGETVTDGEFLQNYGGKGANQAVAAARAGAAVTFLNAVGSDALTDAMLENYARDGIDIGAIRRFDDRPSGTALVMVGAEGDNYLAVAPGANHAITADWVRGQEERIAGARLLILQLEIPVEANREGIRIARKHGVPVQLNFAPADSAAADLLDGVDYLVANEIEAGQLIGEPVAKVDDARQAVPKLRALGPEHVVITLGAKGAVFNEGETVAHQAGESVDVVDTTAAGDTFCGAFAVAISEGRSMAEAVRWANAAAARTVTRLGAQSSIPHRKDLPVL